MKRKKIYIMLGVLAFCCVALFAALGITERQENIRNSEEIILELKEENIQSLAWEYEGTELAYHKDENGVWLYDKDEAFPVSADKMSELLEDFNEFGVSFIIEDVESLSPYGLDAPECSITITTEDESYEIALGDFSTLDEKRYVSIGDGNVYLVNTDPMEKFEIELSDTIENDKQLEYDEVRSISISGDEEYTISYAEESADSYCSTDRYYTAQSGKTVPLDTYRVDDYLASITTINMDGYVSYNAYDADLIEYGLDDPELSITVDYSYEDEDDELIEDSYTIHVSRSAEERDKNPSIKDDEEPEDTEEDANYKAYVRVGESQIIYEISEDKFESLMAYSYDELRHREIFTADTEIITGMDIELDGESYSLTVKEYDEDEEELIWLYGEEEIEHCEVDSELKAVSADHFTTEKAKGETEIAVTVYLEHENFSKVKVVFYRYDGEHCLAGVDGKSVALVPRSEVVNLIEAVNAIILN